MPKKEFYRITVDGIPYVVEVEPIYSGAPQPGPPSTLAPWVLAPRDAPLPPRLAGALRGQTPRRPRPRKTPRNTQNGPRPPYGERAPFCSVWGGASVRRLLFLKNRAPLDGGTLKQDSAYLWSTLYMCSISSRTLLE